MNPWWTECRASSLVLSGPALTVEVLQIEPSDADGPDQQREDHPLVAEAGVAQDHGRDDGHLVAFEDVGGHAGTVTDVVADVVGDGGGVAGVILGDAGLDLAHQVGTDVGRLGIDAAADSHEECQQRSAEAEAQQDFVGVLTVGHEDERAAQEAQAVGEHAGDRAGAVTQLEGGAIAGPRGGGDPQVAPHRQAHPDEADQPGERRSHEKGGRPAQSHLLRSTRPWPRAVPSAQPSAGAIALNCRPR